MAERTEASAVVGAAPNLAVREVAAEGRVAQPPVAATAWPLGERAAMEDEAGVRHRGRRTLPWAMVTGAVILAAILSVTIAAPVLAPYNPVEQRPRERVQGPSPAHLMGTDRLGRDIFSRVLHGGRVSLTASAAALVLIVTLGVSLGLAAGYAGGRLDTAIMRLVDVLMAFPSFILALVVAGLFGPGLMKIVLAATAVWWVSYARVTRSLVLQAKQEGYVLAARAAGARPLTIALREVLPQVLGPIVVLATLDLGKLLLALSGLSFLGLGAQPPTPEWGLMLSEGRAYFMEAQHMMVFPGLMIFATALGLNLLGEGLRDLLDPAGATGRDG